MVRLNSRANCQGATGTLRRNFRNGYMFQGSYTFGRAMNDADVAVGSTAFQDTANIGADYAIAGYDVPHKVALAGVWEIPFVKNAAGLKKTLLGGWQLAGSAIFQSGNPINVTTARPSRTATTTPTAAAAIGQTRRPATSRPAGGASTSNWPGSSASVTSRCQLAGRTATWYATPIAVPVTRT
jgi:hypothetical protein